MLLSILRTSRCVPSAPANAFAGCTAMPIDDLRCRSVPGLTTKAYCDSRHPCHELRAAVVARDYALVMIPQRSQDVNCSCDDNLEKFRNFKDR